MAFVDAALARDIDIPAVSDFDSPTGKGALGTVEGKRITLGNARFLDEEGVATSSLAAQADQLRADGATAIFMGVGRSEEHTSELQSLMRTSYADFSLKKNTSQNSNTHSATSRQSHTATNNTITT